MSEIDVNVLGARVEADGKLTILFDARLVEGEPCVINRVVLAEPVPAADGSVTELAAIEQADIALGPDGKYEGSLTWPLDASQRARARGRVLFLLVPDGGKPQGVGFDFAPAPSAPRAAGKSSMAMLVPLALVVIGVALAVASRAC
jgi:hypothetical protein